VGFHTLFRFQNAKPSGRVKRMLVLALDELERAAKKAARKGGH
jgi:hypothetical protein